MTNNPKMLVLAFLGGSIPAFLWLWFWLKEEAKKKEPKGILTILFIVGMTAVIFALQIEKFIQMHIDSANLQLVLWASAEELVKYLAVLVVVYGTNYASEPVDWPIYLITAALGFAALENALFLIKPLPFGKSLLTGELRFLGSTLLHTVSSGMLGIGIGISLHMGKLKKIIYITIGVVFAIALHSVFNFFIIRTDTNNFLEILKVFSFLWVVTIIVMLLFEKVRRMN